MPQGDGTGPTGQGPRTGRAAGFCAGFGAPGSTNPRPGRGFGRGCGGGEARRGGHGWRNLFHATGLTGWQRADIGEGGAAMPAAVPFAASAAKERQAAALNAQAAALETALADVRERIDALTKEA